MGKKNWKGIQKKARAKMVVLKKAENEVFNSSDKIYIVRNCLKLTVV